MGLFLLFVFLIVNCFLCGLCTIVAIVVNNMVGGLGNPYLFWP